MKPFRDFIVLDITRTTVHGEEHITKLRNQILFVVIEDTRIFKSVFIKSLINLLISYLYSHQNVTFYCREPDRSPFLALPFSELHCISKGVLCKNPSDIDII